MYAGRVSDQFSPLLLIAQGVGLMVLLWWRNDTVHGNAFFS